ncbi:MAG: hypothetical protein ACI8TL_001851 [Natronomonas sp.]|jgi:hypothetical protein
MSENNRQGEQQPQRGQQPPQGGQQRGGQQPQGQRGQPPQGGGRPPQRGGGGGPGGIDTNAVKTIVMWGVVAFAVAGVAFGLLPLLLGTVGGDTTERVNANSTAASEQAEDAATANEIVRNELSDNNETAADAYQNMRYQNGIVYEVIDTAPYLGFVAALLVGLLIGFRASGDEKTVAAGVAVAAVIGVMLFVLLSSGVAAFQHNGMSEDDWREQYSTTPSSWPGDDLQGVQQELSDEDVSTSDVTITGPREIQALNVSYVGLVINGIAIGIIAAIGAAAMAVAGRRIGENIS